jgi:hypothetical protein
VKQTVEVFIQNPLSWAPPFVEENAEMSEVPLQFARARSWAEPGKFVYICKGCLSAGGEVEDVFRTEPFSEEEDDEIIGLPLRIKKEFMDHARQHEVIWRWSHNRTLAKVDYQ